MAKVAILHFVEGDFEKGFTITLEIRDDSGNELTAGKGELPAKPELPKSYKEWQVVYLQWLGIKNRMGRKLPGEELPSNPSFPEREQDLKTNLNDWLASETFRPLEKLLRTELSREGEVRLIIQTDNDDLRYLPWYLWQFFEDYRKAEVALAAPAYTTIAYSVPTKRKIRILAILGDTTGIDIEADRQFLQDLPDCNTVLLPNPFPEGDKKPRELTRQEIDEQLWDEQGWDIFFFAGHSGSKGGEKEPCFYISPNKKLKIGDLRNALRSAIERGLKIAIFNSCDGLGIASDLADLQIPQIIVMREPVPDKVAQVFLKNFLSAYTGGKSLYLSVREAREKLQGLEDDHPSATWLPVIWQQPAKLPPTWEQLKLNNLLAGICPYDQKFKAWLESDKDVAYLLTDKEYKEAKQWAQGKKLHLLDYNFLNACDNLNRKEEKPVVQTQLQPKQKTQRVLLIPGYGDFDKGFPHVIAQIYTDREQPVQCFAKLPPAPEIPELYNRIQRISQFITGFSLTRLEPGTVINPNYKISDFSEDLEHFGWLLNHWLSSPEFTPIRKQLYEQLSSKDEIQLIVQTEDILLQRIPWHLWQFYEKYPKSEIILSLPNYSPKEINAITRSKVRILAVLGHSKGLNLDNERSILAKLDAETEFLVEPEQEEIDRRLRDDRGWDILFFAGHSGSEVGSKKVRIYLNDRAESLTIRDLKPGLKKAIEKGLKLAIFNSCDGLEIAQDLTNLQISQAIVMRASVIDQVAQEFFKYFFEAFASGKSSCLAVREARESLRELEDIYPLASWGPVIFQHPLEPPLTWSKVDAAEFNFTQFSQLLQAAISAKSISSVRVICIDGSQFIDKSNPALDIYDQMLEQNCPEWQHGVPDTLQKLKLYCNTLRRTQKEKRLVLVFYKSSTEPVTESFSKTFLDNLSKFGSDICVVTNQQLNIPLQQFSPNQPQLIANIMAWIEKLCISELPPKKNNESLDPR